MTTGCAQAVNRDSLMESTTFGSFDHITNSGRSLSHLTYLGRVHPRLEVLHPKYCQVSAGRPKNIGKGYKFLTKWHQIWQEFLKIVFTDDFFVSFNPELSDFEIILS